MHVKIEPHWPTQGHLVWFFERAPLRVLRVGDEGDRSFGPQWVVTTDDGTLVEPTLILPEGALEALLAEAEKIIPASHATERHLHDSNEVRNRLLGLVEKLTDDAPVRLVEERTR